MNPEPPPSRPLARIRLWLWPRIRFIGPFLVAGLLGWFGMLRLRPALVATEDLARQQADGARRVQMLEGRLVELESLPELEVGELHPSSLHNDPEGVVAWLTAAEHEARRFGWALQSEIGEVGVRSLSGWELLNVPVRFHLTPAGGMTSGPSFSRLLQWSEWIVRHPCRPEVLALSVTSGAAGPGKCRMDLELRCIARTP